jgi:hypothetical protein
LATILIGGIVLVPLSLLVGNLVSGLGRQR